MTLNASLRNRVRRLETQQAARSRARVVGVVLRPGISQDAARARIAEATSQATEVVYIANFASQPPRRPRALRYSEE